MIYHKPFPIKNLGFWFLLIFSGLFGAYIIFIALFSIWVGLNHLEQDGFWMPILAGTLLTILILWLFLHFSKFILNRMKEKDTINL